MKTTKLIASAFAGALALAAFTATASAAETAYIYMTDAGYGINGGASFTADGIMAYESTLGDLAELYDTIDFTISAADLGGRGDLLFQVYVSADNWGIWANGGETPAIAEAGTEYSFSLNVDDIAATYGEDMVICDMGFQILSATGVVVEVTYNAEFNANGAADTSAEDTAAPDTQKTNPDTGVEGIGAAAAMAALAGGAVVLTSKRRK